MPLIEEIRNAFSDFDISVKSDMLHNMEELALHFKFDADTVVNEWIAYQSSHNHCELNSVNLEKFKHERNHVRNKQQSMNKTPLRPINVYTSENIHEAFNQAANTDVDMLIDEYASPGKQSQIKSNIHATPHSKMLNNSIMDSSIMSPSFAQNATPSRSYGERKNAGQRIQLFGDEITGENTNKNTNNTSVKIEFKSIKKIPKKYMHQIIPEISEVRNASIQYMAEVLQLKYSDEIIEFCSVAQPCEKPIHVVGQICCKEQGGKITASTLLLQGDRLHSNGKAVTLDVSKLQDYSLFRGQIVALRGVNPMGQKFIADKIYDGVLLDKVNKENKEISGMKESLEICVACGPFTTSDTLTYEPFVDLIQKIKADKPDVAILIGPFVDAQHNDIKTFNLNESYEDVQERIFQHMKELEGLTKLIIVPSQRDVCGHPVFSQPPLTMRQPSKSVHLCGDPTIVNINGIQFAITSNDVLLHLSSAELSRSTTKQDRLSRLSKHLLLQHSMYPVHLAHEEVNMDLVNAENVIDLVNTPDVLILPSNLKTFITDLDGCTCVNPGRLAKGSVGGTYSRLHIKNIYSNAPKMSADILRI